MRRKRRYCKYRYYAWDPLRAQYIAENYLTDYKLVNSVRNIFAYTGFL